jgi:hypothetical protein
MFISDLLSAAMHTAKPVAPDGGYLKTRRVDLYPQ